MTSVDQRRPVIRSGCRLLRVHELRAPGRRAHNEQRVCLRTQQQATDQKQPQGGQRRVQLRSTRVHTRERLWGRRTSMRRVLSSGSGDGCQAEGQSSLL